MIQYEELEAIVENPELNIDVVEMHLGAVRRVGFASRQELPDPFDRMIVATALEHHLPLVTKDKRITDLGVVRTIW